MVIAPSTIKRATPLSFRSVCLKNDWELGIFNGMTGVIAGLSVAKKEADKIRKLLNYVRGKSIDINQDSLMEDVKKICVRKKTKLYSITITKDMNETPRTYIDGTMKKYKCFTDRYIELL